MSEFSKADVNIGFSNHGNRGNPYHITYNGKTQTIAEWAKELGLTKSALQARLARSGYDLEKSLGTPKQSNIRYEYDGMYLTIPEWAGVVGCSESTMYTRMRKHNYDVSKCFENKYRLRRKRY